MLEKSTFVTLVPIKKMDRALKFYKDILGGKLLMGGEGDTADSWASLRVGKAEFWLIAPEKWEKRELAYNMFVVDDIKASVAALKSEGVKFSRAEKTSPDTKIDGPIAHHEWGSEAFFKDSEGNQLMLWQAS